MTLCTPFPLIPLPASPVLVRLPSTGALYVYLICHISRVRGYPDHFATLPTYEAPTSPLQFCYLVCHCAPLEWPLHFIEKHF